MLKALRPIELLIFFHRVPCGHALLFFRPFAASGPLLLLRYGLIVLAVLTAVFAEVAGNVHGLLPLSVFFSPFRLFLFSLTA